MRIQILGTTLLMIAFDPGLFATAAPPTAEALKAGAREVLAQLEGEIRLPGLTEPVEVLRDRWGVPHIYARNQHDLFFAQGFITAQDRLFQLDLWRRTGMGELSEVMGPAALDRDRFARLLNYRGDMNAEWASYGPDAREIAAAFCEGINACIDHLGDRLPIEFKIIGSKPTRWRPEDVLGRMTGIGMVRNFQNEINRAALITALGLEKARHVAPTDPASAFAPAPGFDLAGIDKSILDRMTAATSGVAFEAGQVGSNNWVVDGSLSASGRPMLASDPHRSIDLPSLRYLVHLNAPGWNVIGGGEPGVPGVAIGHNDEIAWGFTIAFIDQCDIYVEDTNPADPREYRADGRWEKMRVVTENVAVKGAAQPSAVELRFTRHGPVIHQDEKRNRAYVLRWIGAEPGGAAYLGALAIDRAKTWSEFQRALETWKLPSENMVYADRQGNIGWVATALTPIRKGWDGLLPVPGAEGKYEWQGYLKVEQLPQEFNPARHFIVTANSKNLPPGYPHPISFEFNQPYRKLRLQQRLEAQQKFTIADFQSMQQDVVTLPGLALARLAGTMKLDDAHLAEQATKLARWDGALAHESTVAPLYGAWLKELLAAFHALQVPKELAEFVISQRGVEVMLPALETADASWFGEKPRERRDDFLRTTFAAASKKLAELTAKNGGKPLTWGDDYQRLVFRHPLEKLGAPYAEAFNLGPSPRRGDGFTPNAAGRDGTAGASYREVFDLSDWDLGMATSTPGQSGQPGSPHYDDLLPLWSEGQYFPLKFSRPAVEGVTQHRLMLRPGT